MFQTRRSIDLAHEIGLRKAPTFIIIGKIVYMIYAGFFCLRFYIGAQKCGTTSIYDYICQHPLVVKGIRRETHYFDWRYKNSLENDYNAHYKQYMTYFESKLLYKHPSLITGESTPSYLFHRLALL